MSNRMAPIALVGVLTLAACGEGSESSSDFDTDRACRIGERMVEEIADGDRDGVVRQVERLDDLDGIDDSTLDVDDIDEMAEAMDENAIEDITAEFEAADCDIDVPEMNADVTVSTEPAATTPAATDPPATDPPATEPVETDPPATDPPATDPPATDPPATDPPGTEAPSVEGFAIDIGSTGAGAAIGVDTPTEDIIAAYGIGEMLYSPNTNVVEITYDISDSSFGGDPEWSSWVTITMSATTDTGLEDIRAGYRTAIESSGVAYDFTESTTESDGVRTVGLEADPTDFDLTVPRWDIEVAESDEFEGVLLIEVNRNLNTPGALPPIPEPLQPLLTDTAQIGVDLGWTVTSYRLNRAINSFDGGTYDFGGLRWDISEDDTMLSAAADLKAALGGGPFDNEEESEDSVTFFLPTEESPLFSVRYSEFGGTTASYTT